jgi:primosomal protein N' (replication factor Y) (superfamily II helicase)
MTAIRHPLTYRVPHGLEVRTGQRVQVPLGSRRASGIVLEPRTRVAPGFELRDVLRVLEPEPLLSPELLTLGLWIAEYYLAPVGEVFRAMLPLRAETRRVRRIGLTDRGRKKLAELEASLLDEARQSPEARLLRYLGEPRSSEGSPDGGSALTPGLPIESVRRKFPGAFPELMARFQAEGWTSTFEVERERGQRRVLTVRLASSSSPPAVHGPVPEREHKLSPVARRIVEALEREGAAEDHRDLLKSARASLGQLRKLADAGLVEITQGRARAPVIDSADTAGNLPPGPPPLTAEQATVFDDLCPQLEDSKFAVALLHGITGSGKTEIYMRLIARCLELGRTALMLVPEIALTPAVELQFVARFGAVAVLHSGLSESDRHEAWWRIQRGEAKVVLGTRSAVFAPLDKLGLVVVDEEHESGYKQEETPRYHGRDVAVVRARLAHALAVLGSATPSLESYWNARQGKYRLCTLKERIGGRQLAGVEIVDMRQEFRQTQFQVPMSRRLEEEMDAALEARAQTMILLNRRGYSWFLLCRSCGQSQRCVNCSISLTYHRRAHRLMCHYCGYSTDIPTRCPACASEYLQYVGEGTEKIETKLAELFPGARVERLDRDAARRRGYFRKVLDDFRHGKIDILVGTQLIAKGHDFPGVTLVGAISADIGLGLPDFRAAERTFQLLTQAAGRAGRGDAPGRVLVQTFFPEHYAIRLAAEQNYEGFFAKEMSFRRLMHYPPSAALANVIAQHPQLEQAARIAKQVGDYFENLKGDSRTLKVLGPSPAPLARIQGRYRIQFLLKATSRARLNQILRLLVDYCEEQKIPPQNVMIDMDPVSVM